MGLGRGRVVRIGVGAGRDFATLPEETLVPPHEASRSVANKVARTLKGAIAGRLESMDTGLE